MSKMRMLEDTMGRYLRFPSQRYLREAPNPVLFDKLGSENSREYEDFDYVPEILGEEVQEE